MRTLQKACRKGTLQKKKIICGNNLANIVIVRTIWSYCSTNVATKFSERQLNSILNSILQVTQINLTFPKCMQVLMLQNGFPHNTHKKPNSYMSLSHVSVHYLSLENTKFFHWVLLETKIIIKIFYGLHILRPKKMVSSSFAH